LEYELSSNAPVGSEADTMTHYSVLQLQGHVLNVIVGFLHERQASVSQCAATAAERPTSMVMVLRN
jgi:hypothetical protein